MFGLIAFIILIIFYSCSTEDESIDKSGKTETVIKSEEIKTIGNTGDGLNISVQENLSLFSEQIFVSVENLEIALSKNSYVGFNEQAMQMLGQAEDEYDLKIAFEMAGIVNSQEVINILKNIVIKQQGFIAQNSSFYSLTTAQQTEFLNTSIELSKNTYSPHVPLPITEFQTLPYCAGAFNSEISECAEDFGVCAVFAVAGAYAGLAPGLLAAAYCMTTKLICDGRAKTKYRECVKPTAFEPDPTPPTGELTIHCTAFAVEEDSCWTTDSKGKYVGRYYGPSK